MDKIIQILTYPMACEPTASTAFFGSLVMAMKNGEVQAFEKRLSDERAVKCMAYALDAATGYVNVVDPWDICDPNLPDNSVAILYMEGIIWPWRTFDIENRIAQISNNPRIVGTLIFTNTPGGYAHRIDVLTDTIKNSTKPIAAYVTGLCCSSGQWFVSGCDRIFCASKTDTLGSIGTMTTYMDQSKWLEEMGIKLEELYATKSTKKNHRGREAAKGNFEPIISDLDFYNEIFHETISKNMGIARKDDSPVFDGSDFHSEEAISLGLAHEIATLDTALNWVLRTGLKNKANNNNF